MNREKGQFQIKSLTFNSFFTRKKIRQSTQGQAQYGYLNCISLIKEATNYNALPKKAAESAIHLHIECDVCDRVLNIKSKKFHIS